MMTRKQFNKIAILLSVFKNKMQKDVFDDLVHEFALMLSTENNMFNITRFKNACNEEIK